MDDLDLSMLTDDQIVGLATALATEALRRSPALTAAFRDALITEKERIEAAARGGAQAKKEALAREEQLSKQLEDENQREIARQRIRQKLSGLLKEGARIAGRDIADVTLVLTSFPYERPMLYLNPGTSTATTGAVNLVHYDIHRQLIRTSWKLEPQKIELLRWAEATAAALRAMNISEIKVIGGKL